MTPEQLQELKRHYIGYKRSMTLDLPKDLYNAANDLHRQVFGTPFQRCSKCIPRNIMSLLINQGVGVD